MTVYRIREARVEVCNGYRGWHERRFIAERHVTLLGILSWWWPVTDGRWRETRHEAKCDVERDIELHAPISPPEIIDTNSEALE